MVIYSDIRNRYGISSFYNEMEWKAGYFNFSGLLGSQAHSFHLIANVDIRSSSELLILGNYKTICK